ncbi:MAG: LysM peptidoglycan-binding domain-containing protein [Bacteroidales bacterium]|nr:LysM peptidoglycan-binding domain-containing protein [Bacteroidales bacterium]
MKRIKIVSVVLLLGVLLASSMTATAQEVTVKRAEKTVTIGSKQFYMHHVKAGETLYAIAKAYHVTEDQITDCNPDLKNNGLRAGSVLGIPAVVFDDVPEPETPKPAETPHVVEKQTSQVVTVGGKKFYMHHVKQGETIYGIAKAYEVTEQALRDLNPELSEGLKTGMVIGVPVLAGQPKVEPKPEPKVEPKQEPKVEPKPEPKVEPKPEPKVEPKPEPKVEPKQEPKVVKEEIPAVTHRDTVVEIGGKHYVMHYVNPGETVWGLTQAYQVTEQELLARNPEIADGLKAGMVIGIPVVEATPKEEPKVTPATPQEEPQEEPKITPKEEPQVAPKEEPQEEPKETAQVEPKKEPKINKTEPQEEPIAEPQTQPTPSANQPVFDPDDEFGDGFVIHTVKEAQKTKNLIKRWDITEEEFRSVNPSVGSRVAVGQKVLIPLKNAPVESETVVHYEPEESEEETPMATVEEVEEVESEETALPWERLVYAKETPYDCYASTSHADRSYHVALLVPLYLSEIDKIDTSKDRIEKTKKSRAMKFLQFYEGFMMAADSMTKNHGMRLDLTVMDVTENTAGAERAVEKLREDPVDLIIGPFFSKSFAVVQSYAADHDIFIVNPLSERDSVVSESPNVLKLKPGTQAMVAQLADLIRIKYPKSKVTLLTSGTVKDSLTVDAIEQALNAVVEPEVRLSNAEMLELITKESQRRKMGKRVLSTLEVEGQIFSTKTLSAHPDDETVFENEFHRISYSDADLKAFREGLSAARDNVLVAYGDNLVFATKVLNTINKSAKKYPITLIGLPAWEEFENLLVPNLLNMNAIYFDDHFVDFNDSIVLQFVDDFRYKYSSEPNEYAFEGFDVGWYFLNALMQYGSNSVDCLPYYHLPLLSTRYYFNKSRRGDGLENRYWNMYQYDNHAVELKPVLIYEDEEE